MSQYHNINQESPPFHVERIRYLKSDGSRFRDVVETVLNTHTEIVIAITQLSQFQFLIIVPIRPFVLIAKSASELARSFGISERFIGLTIVALGTSLPELFTSVIAAKKGNADIAVGNIVGSNIFNIFFVVGITSLITDVPFASKFIIDSIFMILAAVLLFVCAIKEKAIGKKTGIIFLSCYIIYFIYLCLG